jgi:hypothetical protein
MRPCRTRTRLPPTQPCRGGRSCPDSADVAASRQAAVFRRLWCSALLRGRGAGGRQPWCQPPTPLPSRLVWQEPDSPPRPARGARQRRDFCLRERTLRRMRYETAARAHEVLALDIDELELRNRCAKGRRKGNAVDVIVRQIGTAPAAAWAAQGPPDRPGVCNRPARPHRAATRRPRPGHRPRGCRTAALASCSSRPPSAVPADHGRCTSFGTRRSPTPPRPAPTPSLCLPNRPHLGGVAGPLRPRLPRRWPADSDATHPDDGAAPRRHLAAWPRSQATARLGQHRINGRTRGWINCRTQGVCFERANRLLLGGDVLGR